MEKLIINVHAEKDLDQNSLDIDTCLEGNVNELAYVFAEAIKDNPALKMLTSRALYLVDDEYIQIDEEPEDVVTLMEKNSYGL